MPFHELDELPVEIEEVILEIFSLSGTLRLLTTYNKWTTRTRDILQRVGGNLRALHSSGTLSRGDHPSGRVAIRTQLFQKSARRAEAEP